MTENQTEFIGAIAIGTLVGYGVGLITAEVGADIAIEALVAIVLLVAALAIGRHLAGGTS